MGSGLLGIGSSALLSYQRALDTIGHNVANVNTPGYSRQRVELTTRLPQLNSSGFIGTGVDVAAITRSYDQFLTNELRSSTSGYQESSTLASLANGLDNLLADQNSGLSPVLGTFFDAIQGAANDPTSVAARGALLGEAGSLVARFQGLNDSMDATRRSLAARMGANVEEINNLAASIASLNQQIVDAQGSANGQAPNDLLDQRDQLVLELSGKVSITTMTQEDGALNVFIGSGQSLVLGVQHSNLGLVERISDPGQFDITIGAPGSPAVVVTNLITGGELGGVLRYREQVLVPAMNDLGRLAIELGTFMNEQHRAGVTLDGQPGLDLFSVASPQVVPDSGNSGSIAVAFNDVSQLTADDYRLAFDGASWNLTRVGSGQAVPMSGSGTPADPFLVEGISITIGAGAVAGDGYNVRPTRDGAASISVLTGNPRDLALASPVIASAAIANTGTGQITPGTVTDISNPAFQSPAGQLSPPVRVRFTSPTSYEVIDQATSGVIDTGTYDPATGADIFPTANLGLDYGYRVRITGNPAASDEFNITYNSSGAADNRNALLLGGMQAQQLMNNGTTSFNDAIGQLVAGVGTQARSAQIGSEVQAAVLKQSEDEWSATSGVNLDEEAADLLRYQQAYQAAAQIIAVSDNIFQTLIGAFRS
ncbi:MAG: flagellar hook-associated protein FlgK [Gammaproteobacteria bacterium]